MDKNYKAVIEKRINLVIENLKSNRMNGHYVKTSDELYEKITSLVPENGQVSVGGSMSLFETGVIDFLRSQNYDFLDRYQDGLTKEDIKEIYFKAFDCDAYFCSTNAITEKGELYNVDGNGNRVAAMIYGPSKVILVVGYNKIVKDIDEAIDRNRRIAAPANVQRLSRKTPCHTTGYCTDCKSPETVCNAYTIIGSQADPDRIHVIFYDKELGY